MCRGHGSSMYLDVILMVVGAIMMGIGDFVLGILMLAAGAGIHFMMGD